MLLTSTIVNFEQLIYQKPVIDRGDFSKSWKIPVPSTFWVIVQVTVVIRLPAKRNQSQNHQNVVSER